MGLLSTLLLAPVTAPPKGVLWVARRLADQAEAERNSPTALRAALATAEAQMLAGEISEDDYDAIEDDLLDRLAKAGQE
ncbi:MAG: gas vesicle protein GvpG [Pseudomonadota bacterium]